QTQSRESGHIHWRQRQRFEYCDWKRKCGQQSSQKVVAILEEMSGSQAGRAASPGRASMRSWACHFIKSTHTIIRSSQDEVAQIFS
ncbi:MAG: hypothetical protein ACOYYJ_07505, partial [Chloroflexota bacterium]